MPKDAVQNNCAFICNYSPDDVLEVIGVQLYLRRFKFPKHRFITTFADDERISEAAETFDRMKQDFPESVRIMENMTKEC